MWCDWEEIYEYLHFDDKSQIGPFKPYFKFLEDHDAAEVIPYTKKYGSFNKLVEKNLKRLETISSNVHDKLVIVSPHEYDTVSLHKVSSEHEAILTILKYLLNGQHVVYVPGTSARSVGNVIAKATKEHLDFVVRNSLTSKARAKAVFALTLDNKYPMYFGPNNKTLKQLLVMSDSFANMEKLFNRTYIFLTRIHCGWC
jgi:hypothetical protein